MSKDAVAAISAVRDLVNQALAKLDALQVTLDPPVENAPSVGFPLPSLDQARVPEAKFGKNLSAVGIELIYRAFDHGLGLRAAARLLDVSIQAAKHRKETWLKAGGLDRAKLPLAFDPS